MGALNVSSALHRASRMFGSRVYLDDGSATLTYDEVDEMVTSLAAGLASRGLAPGDTVGLLLHNRNEAIVALLAAARAGLVAVPLNRRLRAEDIRDCLIDSGARYLIYELALASTALDAVAGAPGVAGAAVVDGDRSAAGPCAESLSSLITVGSSAWSEPTLSDDAASTIYYTSGTTGVPKGVVRSHGSNHAMATGSAATLPVDPSSTWLHVFPIHSAGVYATAGAAMLGGGRVVLADFEPAAVLDLVEVKQVTHFVAGVTMWEMIVRAAAGRSTRLGSLRHALWGGQPMMPATAERVRSLLPVPCVGNYGLTEATCATYGSPEHGDPSASVGWPVHSMEVRIADDDGNDVPDGECGEVLLRGALVMTGYHRRPDETAVAVRDGWLHTGDWGRLDEAGLTVLDRKKDMVITGGENVYPSELEASLSRLEGVRAVAIVGVPDELWGQAVCAFVVAGGSGLRADDVVRHARRHHAGYKVPKHVVFVDDLPRNAIGKVRKQDLRKDFESYAGNPSRSRPGGR